MSTLSPSIDHYFLQHEILKTLDKTSWKVTGIQQNTDGIVPEFNVNPASSCISYSALIHLVNDPGFITQFPIRYDERKKFDLTRKQISYAKYSEDQFHSAIAVLEFNKEVLIERPETNLPYSVQLVTLTSVGHHALRSEKYLKLYHDALKESMREIESRNLYASTLITNKTSRVTSYTNVGLTLVVILISALTYVVARSTNLREENKYLRDENLRIHREQDSARKAKDEEYTKFMEQPPKQDSVQALMIKTATSNMQKLKKMPNVDTLGLPSKTKK